MNNSYTISEFLTTTYAYIITKIFYTSSRLIRRPFYIRGKKHLSLSRGFTTGYNCRFDLAGQGKTLIIGNNVRIGDYVHIVAHQQVIIGDDCLLASKIFISDTSHGIYDNSINSCSPETVPNERPLISFPVTIGKKCWIGDNAVVLAGVTIGDGCIIGSNAVVNKSFPSNVMIAGVPAKIIKVFNLQTKMWEKANIEGRK